MVSSLYELKGFLYLWISSGLHKDQLCSQCHHSLSTLLISPMQAFLCLSSSHVTSLWHCRNDTIKLFAASEMQMAKPEKHHHGNLRHRGFRDKFNFDNVLKYLKPLMMCLNPMNHYIFLRLKKVENIFQASMCVPLCLVRTFVRLLMVSVLRAPTLCLLSTYSLTSFLCFCSRSNTVYISFTSFLVFYLFSTMVYGHKHEACAHQLNRWGYENRFNAQSQGPVPQR